MIKIHVALCSKMKTRIGVRLRCNVSFSDCYDHVCTCGRLTLKPPHVTRGWFRLLAGIAVPQSTRLPVVTAVLARIHDVVQAWFPSPTGWSARALPLYICCLLLLHAADAAAAAGKAGVDWSHSTGSSLPVPEIEFWGTSELRSYFSHSLLNTDQ